MRQSDVRSHLGTSTFTGVHILALESELLMVAVQQALCENLLLVAPSSLVRWKLFEDLTPVLNFRCEFTLPRPKEQIPLMINCDTEENVWP
jgi:hypothetical protein